MSAREDPDTVKEQEPVAVPEVENAPAVDPLEHAPAFQAGNVLGRAAVAGGPGLGRAEVLHLQRTAGNAAVSQMLRERKLARAPEVADPEVEEAEEELEEEREEETAEAGMQSETAAEGRSGTWSTAAAYAGFDLDGVEQGFNTAKTKIGQGYNKVKSKIAQGWDKAKTGARNALTVAKLTVPAFRAARRLIAAASKAAPAVEEALTGVAKQYGGALIGLPFRVKSLESLTRKIRDGALRAPPGTTPAEAVAVQASEIRDALRYTMQIPPDEYTQGVRGRLRGARQQGLYPRQGQERLGGGFSVRWLLQGHQLVLGDPVGPGVRASVPHRRQLQHEAGRDAQALRGAAEGRDDGRAQGRDRQGAEGDVRHGADPGGRGRHQAAMTTQYYKQQNSAGKILMLARIHEGDGALWGEIYGQKGWKKDDYAMKFRYDAMLGDPITQAEAETIVAQLPAPG